MPETNVSRSYGVRNLEEQQAAYDQWAEAYEPDLCAMGYRIPTILSTAFTRFVSPGTSPILDAGCGGGIQAEAIAMLGYGPITGIDLSQGMLTIAREKGFYAKLRQMTLGDSLDFADNSFAAVLSSGTITPKHAPAHSFNELIRVARSEARIVFSLRDDPAQEPAYPEAVERLEKEGAWKLVFQTPSFKGMPYGEPDVTHRVHVYQVC